MPLTREQIMSVAALALLLLACLGTLGLLLQARFDAGRELADRRDVMTRLETRVHAGGERRIGAAPPAAFLDAATPGLASAQLQAHLTRLADAQHAGLMSSGGETSKREDPAETIRLQATVETSLEALRALLYQLESGTPYVFVEVLAVQPVGAAAGRAAENPPLRATLGMRALWRRAAP